MVTIPKSPKLASKLEERDSDHDFKPMSLRYWIEAALAYLLYGFFAILPVSAASAIGGKLAEWIGPRLGASKKADKNIAFALPDLSAEERQEIIRKMWNNLGRVIAEYPHLGTLWKKGHVDCDHLASDFPEFKEQGGLFVSGHIGNWELCIGNATFSGMETAVVYRAPNNKLVDKLVRHARSKVSCWQFRKGPQGAKKLFIALRNKISLGFLIDQKLSSGVAVPFFGHDAMTAPAAAQFALKMKRPVSLARIIRVKGTHFKMTVTEPLDLPDTGDLEADSYTLLCQINQQLENWIREYPEQWLWLHRRWSDVRRRS